MGTTVVVPVKRLSAAKTRLRRGFGPGTPALVLAMAQDVVSAALQCRLVDRVLVSTADPAVAEAVAGLGAEVCGAAADAGLNEALDAAMRALRHEDVLCVPADCPCTTADDLADVVAELHTGSGPVFVADADGDGTTILGVPAGLRLRPRYGPASAAAHSEYARLLAGPQWQRLGRDVDTIDDLAAALALGVGPTTAALLSGRS